MSVKSLPPVEYLREALDYNPDTGILIWKVRPINHFASTRAGNIWNTRFSGKQAGTAWKNLRVHIKLMSTNFQAGRVIWALMTGTEPAHCIDHIDGNGLNNKWNNLRQVTHAQNMFNKGAYKRRCSELPKGVYWGADRSTHKKPFVARIRVGGKLVPLGYFTTPEDAHAAYIRAAEQHFGEFKRRAP